MANEKRLIDANNLTAIMRNIADHVTETNTLIAATMLTAIDIVAEQKTIVAEQKTVDAVEVVRCKDCKHCCLDLSGRENHLCMRKEVGFVVRRKANDFCSYGERKV